MIPTKKYIEESYQLIKPFIHKTTLLHSASIDSIVGAEVFFKCENFQKAGSFKYRGATNAILRLSDNEKEAGVATHSSGNHAQALSKAALVNGINAHIVIPENAKKIKIAGVKEYQGNIYFCKPTLDDREATLAEVIKKTDATEIHPYNNYNIIAGQASCAKEIYEEIDNLDLVICPVGGGGLLSGTLLSSTYFSPTTDVIAAEPEGANDAYRSIQNNTFIPSIKPVTIADGLLTSLGDKTWPIIQENIKEIVCVDDESILKAMRMIWERMKIIVEPSSAIVLAALLKKKIDVKKYKKIALIISGGNIDVNFFSTL
jgi:threonine dehydratase